MSVLLHDPPAGAIRLVQCVWYALLLAPLLRTLVLAVRLELRHVHWPFRHVACVFGRHKWCHGTVADWCDRVNCTAAKLRPHWTDTVKSYTRRD